MKVRLNPSHLVDALNLCAEIINNYVYHTDECEYDGLRDSDDSVCSCGLYGKIKQLREWETHVEVTQVEENNEDLNKN